VRKQEAPPAPEVSEMRNWAIIALILGGIGNAFWFAPVIQYQWAFVFGGGALITAFVVIAQTGGLKQFGAGFQVTREANMAIGAILMGVAASAAGYAGYTQVQDAVNELQELFR
jgi:hypothetical protein